MVFIQRDNPQTPVIFPYIAVFRKIYYLSFLLKNIFQIEYVTITYIFRYNEHSSLNRYENLLLKELCSTFHCKRLNENSHSNSSKRCLIIYRFIQVSLRLWSIQRYSDIEFLYWKRNV